MPDYTGRFTTSRRASGPDYTDNLTDALDGYHPSLHEQAGHIAATISYPAENWRQAAVTGDAIISRAMTAAGLPGQVTAAEIMTTDVFDRMHGFEPLPELLSVTEAAAELGISRQAVHQRLESGSLDGVKAGGTWVVPRAEVDRAAAAKAADQ